MKKLTAEKCREQFEEWGKSQRCELDKWVRGDRAGEYKNPVVAKMWQAWKASRDALPILEQQERGCQKCGGTGMADSGGTQPWGEQILIECDCKSEQHERGEGEWIEWGGGLVPPVTGLVEVRYRNGREHSGCKASDYSWSLGLGGLTIIAYRIIPEQPTNQNGEQ